MRRPERSYPVDCAPGLCGRAQRTARSPFYQSRAIGTTRPRGLPQETCHRCGEPEGLAEGYRFYEGIEQWVEPLVEGRWMHLTSLSHAQELRYFRELPARHDEEQYDLWSALRT